MLSKWWIYQRERFPVLPHGVLIAAFSFSAVAVSAMLRGQFTWPPWPSLCVAFVTCFIFFLQLRIADEFKDAEEDAQYRPYRPVPRGLITLRELAVVFALGALVQLVLAWWLEPRLVWLLGATWLYLALMSKEFFVRRWLVSRPVVYLLSHMLIMPLIDLYAASTDWLVADATPPPALVWFLLASFFNGIAIEIGRKTRSPADEEEGVSTYSVLWGRSAAVGVWLASLCGTWACASIVAHDLGFFAPTVSLFAVGMALTVTLATKFIRQPEPGRGRWLEHLSGLWTLALYVGLGAGPLLWGMLSDA